MASEIVKAQIHRGRRRELYYFRDQQGLEVDFVVPVGPSKLALLEAKHTRTPTPDMATALARLAGAARRYKTESWVVLPQEVPSPHRGLGAAVNAVALRDVPRMVLHLPSGSKRGAPATPRTSR